MDFLTGQDIQNRGVIRSLLFTIGLLATSTFHCLAEERSIFGLNFEVESLVESSPDIAELRMLGITQIVPKNELDLKIVSSFFDPSNPKQTKLKVDVIPLNRLEQFTLQAAKAEAIDIAAHALFAMGLHDDSVLESMRTSINTIKTFNKSSQILETATSLVEQTNTTILPLFAISAANCEVTAKCYYQLPQDHEYRKKLYQYAAAETTSLLINQHIDHAKNLLTCMRSTFNSKEFNIIHIERLSDILPDIIREFERTREYKFPNTSELASGDKELEEILTTSLSIYLISKSKQFLGENEPGYALWLISRVPEIKRNIETLAVTQQSLLKLDRNGEKAILTPGVSQYLADISQTSPNFKVNYIQFLVQLTDQILKEEKPERLQVILGLLTALNRDPSEINDTVRVNLASYYVNRGAKDMGIAVYAGLKGGLPLRKKAIIWLKIIWLTYPIAFTIMLTSALGFLVCVLFSLIRSSQAVVKLSRLHLKQSDSGNKNSEEPKESSELPLFVKKGLGQQLTPLAQEYVSLVSFFELDPNSSVQDIKHAYREKIKGLHPDMKMSSQTGTEAQEIMKVRKAYDRLLEIHKKNLISDEELNVLKKRNEVRNNEKTF
jgi:hypothetical protein